MSLMDVLEPLCARGFLRQATRLCLTSKEIAAALPMGTGRQVYDAAKDGKHAQLTVFIEYWRGDLDSPEVLNWAPSPRFLKVLRIKATKAKKSALGRQWVHSRLNDSPLVAAARQDRPICAELLVSLARVVDVNKECNGLSALHWACRHGNVALARVLLAAPRIKVNKKDASLTTPLHIAAAKGHAEIVRLLVAFKGVELHAKDKQDKSAKDLAQHWRHSEVVVILAEAYQKKWVMDAAGNRLHEAVGRGDMAALRLLVREWSGNDVVLNHAIYPENNTPMHMAVLHGHGDIVYLLAATPGVDCNKVNWRGWSPLMYAVESLPPVPFIIMILLAVPGLNVFKRVKRGMLAGKTALGLLKIRSRAEMSPLHWDQCKDIENQLRRRGLLF